ncbi:hypothetical protein ACTP13_24345 [Paenibacillus peoriae]|uniref:hypothetical protein n=1 Tax=Paenibacillus peoriae TaxID=59893 RepID=UPI003F97FBE2
MSKIRSSNSIASIQRKIKEGRGQGHFSEYKPWLTVHDVPSIGIVTRILGWKSGRLHHYLSEHFELARHYQMEWSKQVIDIREQFPLFPLDKTLYIAQKLGIKHPTDPKNKLPIIMTTDMLLTVKQEESIKFIAHSATRKAPIYPQEGCGSGIRDLSNDNGTSGVNVTPDQNASIQRIFQQNIQLTSSHVSSQASRNSSGNHVKLSQSARIRSTGRECIQGRSPKSAGTPPECRHASNSSIDGKPFPAFLLHSLFLGKILTPC